MCFFRGEEHRRFIIEHTTITAIAMAAFVSRTSPAVTSRRRSSALCGEGMGLPVHDTVHSDHAQMFSQETSGNDLHRGRQMYGHGLAAVFVNSSRLRFAQICYFFWSVSALVWLIVFQVVKCILRSCPGVQTHRQSIIFAASPFSRMAQRHLH